MTSNMASAKTSSRFPIANRAQGLALTVQTASREPGEEAEDRVEQGEAGDVGEVSLTVRARDGCPALVPERIPAVMGIIG